jgi:uncharacterized membrane protein
LNKNQAIGIATLIIGIGLLASGISLLAINPGHNGSSLLSTNQYAVGKGDFVQIGIPLASAGTVQGKFTQNNGTTVNFYLMNSTQQNAFANCAPCSSPAMLNASNPQSYSYSERVPSAGTYYLIFDNSNGNKAVSVSITASLAGQSNNNLTIFYAIIGVGVVLVIIGAVLAVTKPKTGKAQPAKSESTVTQTGPKGLKQPTTTSSP